MVTLGGDETFWRLKTLHSEIEGWRNMQREGGGEREMQKRGRMRKGDGWS
jgi:hypothetical protein